MSSACGPQNVIISPKSFRVELPKKSLVISGAAPDWKILTVNTRGRLYCETPLKEFKASYIMTSTQLHLTELSLMQEIPSSQRMHKTRNGVTCIDYSVGQVDDVFNAFKDARSATYRVLADAKYPKAAGHVVKLLCGFNSFKTDQFPLALQIVTRDGLLDRFLRTVEMEPVKDIRAIAPPKNYKRVDKEIDVFRDAQVQAEIREILDAP